MNANDRPRYVLSSPADASAVLSRLARAGWISREGFAWAAEPTRHMAGARLVLFGPVRDLQTVQLAVLAAARGAGVVAICDPASEPGRALIDDLSRLGPVHRGPVSVAGAEPTASTRTSAARLIPEQRALLERLANGETIASAAAAEFLSLRTANRRIARAREMLGVRTTREAVLAYLRQRGG